MRTGGLGAAALLAALLAAGRAAAVDPDALAEAFEDALSVGSSDGTWRAGLGGFVDLETYTIDERPPALLRSSGDPLFAPRLSLLLQAEAGRHLEFVALGRFDRGFDPEDGGPRVRADEYFLRWTPLDTGVAVFKVGKFATGFGSWVGRHMSWENPLVNAPLPYEVVTTVSDKSVPTDPAAFLARQDGPDKKSKWVPIVWGPSYTSGVAVLGRVARFDYAVEVKNRSLSSRPSTWGLEDTSMSDPAVTGRLGFRPGAAWTLGVSGSAGPYLTDVPRAALPPGTTQEDFDEIVGGADLAWAHGPWQAWSEVLWARFDVPNVGQADVWAYYLEMKRKLGSRLWLAGRWNQQLYGDVPNGRGGEARWDDDVWRVDVAAGVRWNRLLQTKLQYSINRQTGPVQQGEQMVAVQVTLRF